jgi:protein-disulfide isomerase
MLAAGVFIWKTGFTPAPARPSQQAVQKVNNVRLDASHLSHITGKGDVVIVEFTDFQCPFCGKHARDTLPILRKGLIDSGRARYASINYPLAAIHPAAIPSAKAAECAGEQGKFWEMHERLFSDATASATDRLDEHLQSIGLDLHRFKQCVTSDRVAIKVQRDHDIGQRLGVSSTPAFFVGKLEQDGGATLLLKISGAKRAEVFERAVEEVRSGKSTTSSSNPSELIAASPLGARTIVR